MNKKGFTLIELLAVIVILAIIALIAVPIVLNIVNGAKESANLRSVENYATAVKNAVLTYQMSNPTDNITECKVQTTGYLKCNGETIDIPVEVEGTKAVGGSFTFESGKVVAENIKLENTVGTFKYASGKGEKQRIVYLWNDREDVNGPTLNEKLKNTYYEELPSDKTAYLKYKVNKDDVVTNSYACVKFNGTEERCLEGGSADTYGWVTSKTDSTGRVAKLYAIEQEEISGVSCGIFSSASTCSDGSVFLYANSHGVVSANDDDGYCSVYDDDSSSCGV